MHKFDEHMLIMTRVEPKQLKPVCDYDNDGFTTLHVVHVCKNYMLWNFFKNTYAAVTACQTASTAGTAGKILARQPVATKAVATIAIAAEAANGSVELHATAIAGSVEIYNQMD